MNELTHISMKIAGTIVPDNIKYVYCFAHNNINIPCMVKGLECYRASKIICILDNTRAMSGVSTSDEVSAIYNSYDFKTETIPYYSSSNSINTRTESESLVNWISANNIQQLAICAPPYHTLRAFMTLVSVCIERKVNVKIYAVNGMVGDWNDITITHSGNTIQSFNCVVELEVERIKKYIDKGDICPCDEIWTYIK